MFPLEAKCLPHYTTTYNFILFFLSLLGTMRPEDNSLDLNNLPDEYGKQVLQDSSSSGYRKNESGLKDAKEEFGKVYECRFCSLKFCKSQALGGHMNRHRQERETETLNHARQLVYRNDHTNLPTGCCEAIVSSGGRYHSAATNMGEGTVRMRFPRYISTSSPIQITAPQLQHLSQPSQNIFYASPSRSLCFPSANEYSCIGAPVFGGSLHNQDGF